GEARSRGVNGVDAPAPETLESGPEQTPLSSNALRLELVSAPPPEDPLKPATPPPVARALSPRSLLMLQRSFGNAAVAELVRRSQAVAPPKPDPSPSPLVMEDRGFSPSASGGGQGGGPAPAPHRPPAAPPPRPAPASGGGRFAPTRPSPAHAAAGPRPAPPLAPAMGEGLTAGAETEFGQAVVAQQAILTLLAEQKK